jgi:hypothetical protein
MGQLILPKIKLYQMMSKSLFKILKTLGLMSNPFFQVLTLIPRLILNCGTVDTTDTLTGGECYTEYNTFQHVDFTRLADKSIEKGHCFSLVSAIFLCKP